MAVPVSNLMLYLTKWLLPLCILLILQTTFACNQPPPGGDGSCRCGMKNVQTSKIVGGQPANKHEYPWMVALVARGRNEPFCGGSLITERHVLTAAHCMINKKDGRIWDAWIIQVLLFKHRTDGSDLDYNPYDVSNIENHDYRPFVHYNDFSILTIDRPVHPSFLMPVCLPADTNKKYEGQVATATGWGQLRLGGPRPEVLQEVDVTVTTNKVCKAAYPALRDSIQICAMAPGKDACKADSGGPLIVEENGRWTLVGVTSFGDGCAKPGKPGVYGRVTGVMDWIREHTSGACSSARQSFP